MMRSPVRGRPEIEDERRVVERGARREAPVSRQSQQALRARAGVVVPAEERTKYGFAGMSEALDAFGRLVMVSLRDKAFDHADRTLEGHWKAPSMARLQADLSQLTVAQQDVARRLVRSAVDSAIHEFLFALQEYPDVQESVRVLVRGVNVTACSDGLHGEPFGEDGWQARFSRYGRAPEVD